MITITCKNDIEKLNKPNIPYEFKKYIENYLNEMLLRFDCDNLNLGSIFVLENESELVGTYSPSNASQFMNVGLITNNGTLNVTQLFFFEKAYAKIVFVDSSIIENYTNQVTVKE